MTHRAQRRLSINWILPRTSLAGGIKSNRLIAEAMVRRGHDVTIAYVAVPRPWPRPWQVRGVLRRCNEEWQSWGREKRHHLESSIARLLPVARSQIRSSDVPNADVSIATFWVTAEWMRDWPRSKGMRAYFIRGYEVCSGDPSRVRATYRLPWQKLVISRWLQRLMAEEFGDVTAAIIPNGIDRCQFDSTARKRNRLPTVGFLYGDSEIKGGATALEAIRLLRAELPELRAVSFGAGPLARSHVTPACLRHHVRPPQSVIPELYRSADCWLVPSTSEGLGMPGLEAAACHCPLVVTRCGGPEDYCEDGVNGFLVDVGDAEGMARRLLQVLRAPDSEWESMSAASYAISKRFDWDQSAEMLERVLLERLETGG